MMHHPHFVVILLGQMGFAVLIGLFFGACPATMVEVFPARVRCSALSVGYNLCLGVLGGTTPLVVTYLIARGFGLWFMEPAFRDPASGELLQVDGIFARR